MRNQNKTYELDYKVEAISLARKIGITQASAELKIPHSTLNGWVIKANQGKIDTGVGTQAPKSALTQASRLQSQDAEIKALKKENARLKEENKFLEEAASFFAASRRK